MITPEQVAEVDGVALGSDDLGEDAAGLERGMVSMSSEVPSLGLRHPDFGLHFTPSKDPASS